jgi:REP element-mobilizing transposase RayT
MRFVHTKRFHRGKLPHWEVENGRYFVTVRLGDSLSRDVVARLLEIHRSLEQIEASSPQFAGVQRQYFRTMEKHLDAGIGACLLRNAAAASKVKDELDALDEWSVTIPHFTIMPNHWHALIVPSDDCAHSLGEIMKRVKGRTGTQIRTISGGCGAVWQREWFDRWIRNDYEWEKTVLYIRDNPVKAGLVSTWREHPWTR